MPLQNRVDPFGVLHAVSDRGGLMGNRGGRFHNAARGLGLGRHVSRRWIACVCEFRGRRRAVWGDSYTELFFLDEPTALAAGHRPCFECRRADAIAFADAFGGNPNAGAMDRTLDAERRRGREKRMHGAAIDELPDGAMIARAGEAFAIRGAHLLKWSFAGYTGSGLRPRGAQAELLTPPSICAALSRGYAPIWHASAALIRW